MISRENRRIAFNWAKMMTAPNKGMVISDQFWAPFENVEQKLQVLKKLKRANIEVFQGPGEYGAIFVHRKNRHLKMLEVKGDLAPAEGSGAIYEKDGNIALLMSAETIFQSKN
ncbi:hypothetical protein [Marivivens donghaensis]|uniref:hypothetical protein n=1 Tax=Marivivens donghaensis TaxID=1699413 RepID=UPI00201EA59D|nr:hypothetical protein [Marivivens donghaensis]MCL7408176.1 hypothetical protein [Marivivens donghaensis]MDN3703843.1 hypothetical protein [Marivivens donghaensis]